MITVLSVSVILFATIIAHENNNLNPQNNNVQESVGDDKFSQRFHDKKFVQNKEYVLQIILQWTYYDRYIFILRWL